MPGFEAFDVIKVPFPYTNRRVRQRRPALVVGSGTQAAWQGLVWVLMITSTENRGWEGDVEIVDLEAAGLPAASIVRTAKIACIDGQDAERLGTLVGTGPRRAVASALAGRLAGVLETSAR